MIQESSNAITWIKSLLIEPQVNQMRGEVVDISNDGTYTCCAIGLNIVKQESIDSLRQHKLSTGLKTDFGMADYNRMVGGKGHPSIVSMNDDYHFTFAEVASYLIRHSRQYFHPDVSFEIIKYLANSGTTNRLAEIEKSYRSANLKLINHDRD